jgi:uncharacterized protein with HEPN domain
MNERDRAVLQKMIKYAKDALRYVQGCDANSFMADDKTLSACAFVVGQIGELANEISEETQLSNSEIPWRSIRGMRNRIVHDYENVDLAVIWGTISESLPVLIRQLEKVL